MFGCHRILKIVEFVDEMAEAVHYKDVTTKEALIKYSVNALVIIGAATWKE